MKNVLYDAMKELYEMYIENGESDEWYIKFLYAGVSVDEFEEGERRIGVCIDNSYYCAIIGRVLYTVQYPYNKPDIDEKYFETTKKIEEAERGMKKGYISFEELEERGLFDEVLEQISWVFERREVVFNKLNSINLNTFGRKRKFESMLEDL